MGANDGLDRTDVEGQVRTLYAATVLLMCLTGVVVGDKAARLLALLLGVLFVSTMVINVVDLAAIGNALQVNITLSDHYLRGSCFQLVLQIPQCSWTRD